MADSGPWREEVVSAVAEVRISNVDKHLRAGEVPVKLCNYMDAYANEYLGADYEFADGTATHRELAGFGLRSGDIVVTKDSETPDDIGVAAVLDAVPPKLVCGYHLAVVRPRPSVNPVWLMKLFNSDKVRRHLAERATGSTRYGLSQSSLASVRVPVAPREEQDRAAEILRCLDQTIAHTERLIAKLELMKEGILDDLLTRGIDVNGEIRDLENHPEEFRDSSVGIIPRQWDVSSVDAEFDIASGITLGPHRRPRRRPAPYLRVANVFRERLVLDDVLLMEVTEEELADRTLKEGDLLIVEGHANPDEIGRCAMATQAVAGFAFQNHLFRLRARALNLRFALHWLNSRTAREYWRRVASSSSGLSTINRSKLRRLKMVVPGRAEQDRIAERATDIDDRLHAERLYRDKLHLIRRGLSVDLLIGRIRVTTLLK